MDEKIEYYYDSDETDERLQVELWEPSPYIPPVSQVTHWFDGFHFDERGLVILYHDGDGRKPKTYEMQVVFSSGFENMRIQNDCGLFEDGKLFLLKKKAGVEEVKFWAFRCKYTNYFNWCVHQSLNQKYLEEHGWHYVLAATSMLIDVFSVEPPRVFFNAWGMNLSEGDFHPYPANDILYD